MTVSIKQLKAFVAVVEEKSFSVAAQRLNATQSGMSMLVQNLELSIGKVNNSKSKIKVVDCLQENCVNFISAKFFGNFDNIESARNEIKSLTFFGSLKTNLVKVDLN